MVPQQQTPVVLPETQAEPPHEEKPTKTSAEKQAGIKALLRLLTSVLSFALGVGFPLLSLAPGITIDSWTIWGIVFAAVVGVIGGFLSMSFWSLLLVCAPLFFGLLIGFPLLISRVQGMMSPVSGEDAGAVAVWITLSAFRLIPLLVVVALMSAMVGTFFGLAIEPWLTKRLSPSKEKNTQK